MSEEKISIKDLMLSAGKQLRQDFQEIQSNNPHAAESGAEAEIILKEFLKERLPRRFDIQSGLVVGQDGTISNQTDLIIFDALNSPIYRKGPRVHILPRDNVAVVIEVKSKLNKDQLKDSAKKIASVKKIKATPITKADQPVTFSDMIMTNTLGCVFAFDSYTSLDTLAENLKDINSEYASSLWIDLVVVLDKGYIGFAMQSPFQQIPMGFFGGDCVDSDIAAPFYIHLIKHDAAELTLNHFFFRLMAQLTHFRKKSTIEMSSLLGPEPSQFITIQGYQYNLSNNLVPAQESHMKGKFKNPEIRFNIYEKKKRVFCGQVCLLPWQDGYVITCSVNFDPMVIFEHYFKSLKLVGIVYPPGKEMNIYCSSVLHITEEDFIQLSKLIHKDLITVRDSNDDIPPPIKI